ncbi:MAG: SURF1 family protein [Nocardioides sp.]
MRALLAPRFWGVHLLALVCVVAAAWLGAWQYGAWQERRAAEATDLTQLDPVPLEEVMGPDDPFPGDMVGHPVIVGGTWVPDGTVLVSGREHDGRSGYWVVTPLALTGPGTPAIPVVRGWAPSPESAPPAPTGSTSLVGGLQPPEGSTVVDQDPEDDVLPQLRIADLIQHVDQDLYGAYVVADDPAGGLERADLEQLPDAGSFTALRNLLYALEWWVFGAFAIFIWWRHLRDTVQRADAAEDPVPSDA